MGTSPSELPAQGSPTQIVGQQSGPTTTVPTGGGPSSIAIAGRRTNTLAVVSLVTALIAPFGHVTGVAGLALIITSIVTGHMARAQIRRTGEEGATLALIGLIISYVHVVVSVLVVVFFFGVFLAIVAAIFHAAATGG